MADDKNYGVLAARVLSYLKRKAGDGRKPSEAETKAAAVALNLLSIAFADFASDPAALLEKLKQISRKSGKSSDDNNEANSARPHLPSLDSQQSLQKLDRMYDMMSKIMANS